MYYYPATTAHLMVKTTSIAVIAQSLRIEPQSAPTASPATAAAPRRAAVVGSVNNRLIIASGLALLWKFGYKNIDCYFFN